MKVYIVYGSEIYECQFAPLRAYASSESAQAIVAKLRAHRDARPQWPQDADGNDDDDNDDAMDAYHAQQEQWRAAAPLADADYACFDILEMEVLP